MSGKGRKKGGQGWMQAHVSDAFVQRARAEGYRSRAVYKLREIDTRDQLLKPGSVVLELGAAPGGWTQYVAERVGTRGRVVASDLLAMDALPDVQFVQGDFAEQAVADALVSALGEGGADLVLSDMAPNLSGVMVSDQARAIGLCELALDMALTVLSPSGVLVLKAFQGAGYDAFVRQLRDHFALVRVRKPEASRPRSREVYLVASQRQ